MSRLKAITAESGPKRYFPIFGIIYCTKRVGRLGHKEEKTDEEKKQNETGNQVLDNVWTIEQKSLL